MNIRPGLAFAFVLLFVPFSLHAVVSSTDSSLPPVHRTDTLTIAISLPSSSAGAANYVNGFRRRVSGESIPYHSSHPDANTALIARARSDMRVIAWESDTVRETPAEGFHRFLWLAGIDRGGLGLNRPIRNFRLFVNDQHWFTFGTRKDTTAFHWRIEGKEGAALEFLADQPDRHGDVFGTMILTVPAKQCPPGKSLLMRVEGEDAGAADWFMTMQYTFNFVPGIRCEPVMRNDAGIPRQLLRCAVDNLVSGAMLEIGQGGVKKRFPLTVGGNVNYVLIDPVREPAELPVISMLEGHRVAVSSVRLDPVAPRDVYLIPYSHNDIGYSDPQPVVLEKQCRYLEQALEIIERTKGYPAGAQFRWNIEILWPLEQYLRQASDAKRSAVIDAVRAGRIGLNAFFAGVLTGLAQPVEMSHFFDEARKLRREYGISIETAVATDVPGFTWGIVPALAHAGVKYFAIAPNAYDRIGYAYELWGDKPFRWESQSGEESVLAWMAGSSYSQFHEGTLAKLGDEKMFAILRGIDSRHPPYAIYDLPYTIGGDNGPPDSTLPDFVRSWNERYVSPRLVIGTHAELFAAFTNRYGDSVRTVRGDFTPYWEDGAASTAYETILNRRSVDRLVQAEALWSMREPDIFPCALAREAWRSVVLWDEHTWGAWNSVSDPENVQVKAQWEYKRQFALDADRLSRELMKRTSRGDSSFSAGSYAVTNTLSWNRTALVIIPAAGSAGRERVHDARGSAIPSQRMHDGSVAFLARDVPAFGSRSYSLTKGPAVLSGKAKVSGTVLTNGRMVMRIDASTGAVASLKRIADGREYADTALGGLNRFLYVPGRDPKTAQGVTHVRIREGEQGPLVASLIVTADAPGCRSFETEYRLVSGMEIVEIINRLDKLPVRQKEGVHFAFPFAVDAAQPRFDVASGIVRPEADQLAGACKNFLTAQSWMDVSNGSRGVTLALPDAPMFQLGAITAEQPWMRMIASSPIVYSYAMNNYWHTNYKAEQEGPVEFRYVVTLHDRYDASAAVRFGMESRSSLIIEPVDSARPASAAPVQLSSTDVVVLSLRPADSTGAVVMHLYNPTDALCELSISGNRGHRTRVYLSDVDGSTGPLHTGPLRMKPHATRYVRIEMP